MSGFVQALGLWVREIIAVLFLAAVLEMILPETDLKRFARVAVGFFVVLAVGKPILALLGGGFYIDPTLSQLGLGTWREVAVTAPAGTGTDTALDRGRAFEHSAQARALESARAALAGKLVELARREPEVSDARAVVVLEDDPATPAYGSLRAIHLTVWVENDAGPDQDPVGVSNSEVGTGSVTTSSGPPEGVVVIEPVQVTVEPVFSGSVSTSDGHRADASEQSLPAGMAEQVASRLRSVLVLLVGVPPGGLTIEVLPAG